MKWTSRLEQIVILPRFLFWSALSIVVGALAGTASAFFLASLDWATKWRETHLWIICFLPLGGFFVGWIYHRFGKSVEAGNNLIIDEIHDPKAVIPLRMTPLVLFGTVATHFFGGSAGREGTAVQMGASLADQLNEPLRLSAHDRRILLMAGISAGFAAVFGTPLAGAIFGLEVLAIGRLRYDAIYPCFIAATVGHLVTLAWGIHHTEYSVGLVPDVSSLGIVAAILAGAAFGTMGMLFATTTHAISKFLKEKFAYQPFRPFIGGILVAGAVWALGTTRYIGLGIPTIVESFKAPLPSWDFFLKFLFTAVTLGAGFKGGEVTPLFFIGATLGNALSHVLPLPLPLLSGMGFVAVFAGAANTPLSSTLMAVELFGGQAGLYAGLACVASYLFSGHAGIYHSQRIGHSKHSRLVGEEGHKLSHLSKIRASKRLNVLQDIDPLGYPLVKGVPSMKTTVMRFYFKWGAKLHRAGFWQKLMAPDLGSYLVKEAKAAGIEQAVLHPITMGFMKGEKLAYDMSETPPPHLPRCVELLGEEAKLKAFAEAHRAQLKGVRVVLLRAEDVISDSASKH